MVMTPCDAKCYVFFFWYSMQIAGQDFENVATFIVDDG